MSEALQAALDEIAVQQPLLHRLAMFASLAVRIEPPLLRRLRQQLVAEAEPGLEADLWFSPLVESFDSDACVLYPWVAEQLRTRLKASGRLDDVWAIMAEAHADAPDAQRVEEQVAHLALQGDDSGAASALRGALKAMLASPERGVAVARWAMHALPRLPSQLASQPEVRALEQGMHSRIAVIGAAPGWRDSPLFDHARDGWVLPAATTSSPVAQIGLCLDGLALRVCEPADVLEPARLAIPDSRTRRLQVRATDGAGRVRYAALRGRPGEQVVFDAVPSDIEITTEAGEVHGLEPLVDPHAEAAVEAAPSPAPMPTPSGGLPIKSCRYSAYISHAQADDDAWGGWVSDFGRVLEHRLRERASGFDVPPPRLASAGLSSDSAVQALLGELALSFALIAVVHDHFVASRWCLKELELFHGLVGPAAFRERLYVVAMSQSAMRRLESNATWQRLVGPGMQVWTPFFSADRPDAPVRVYADEARQTLSREFFDPFDRLLTDLAEKIDRSVQTAPAPVSAAAPSPAQPRVLIGVVSLELDARVISLRRQLRELGVQADSLNREALYGEFPEFASADLLLLPFNDAQPMVSTVATGGHLALQRDAWLRRGKPADALVWVDMRHVPAAQPVFKEHAGFIADIAAGSVRSEAVLARLGGSQTSDDDESPDALHIYIESSESEPLLWRAIGDLLVRRWDSRQRSDDDVAWRGALRPCALRVDDLNRMATLHDAAAVILLAGRKSDQALLAMIDQVERLLPDAETVASAIVTYLSPVRVWEMSRVRARGWPVLQFVAASGDAFVVVPDDAAQLDRFLDKVLLHRNRPAQHQ